jgi:hypothetical protein
VTLLTFHEDIGHGSTIEIEHFIKKKSWQPKLHRSLRALAVCGSRGADLRFPTS